MTILRVVAAVGCLLVIMAIVVFALLGRTVVLCVQWAGKLGENACKKNNLQENNPPAAGLGRASRH